MDNKCHIPDLVQTISDRNNSVTKITIKLNNLINKKKYKGTGESSKCVKVNKSFEIMILIKFKTLQA